MPHDTKENRIQANLSELRGLLDDDPELHERFHEHLNESTNLEKHTMAETPTSMRIPDTWLEDAEDLAEHYQRTGEYEAFGSISRALVLRLALQEGLKSLQNKREKQDRADMSKLING